MKNAQALLLLLPLAFSIQAQNVQPPGADGRRAKACCGFLEFVTATEDAAPRSKFTPTPQN